MEATLRCCVDFPRLTIAAILLLTLVSVIQLPKMTTDTDPENMLEPDAPVRVFHEATKRAFGIHELIVVGFEAEPDVFTAENLAKLFRINREILNIKGVIVPDVLSLVTTDTMRKSGDLLDIRKLLESPPGTQAEAGQLKETLLGNPLFREKLISKDGRRIAFYIPIERKDMAARVTKEIQALIAREPGITASIAGLPMAEMVFGEQMFILMGVLSPLTMLVIAAGLWVLFKDRRLILAPLLVSMLSVLWTMGLLIGLGYPVHIMSSMIPVFLMVTGLADGIHILSQFHEVYPRYGEKRTAILETMKELYSPVLYTSYTVMAGFGSLSLVNIPPIRIFGLFVAIGVFAAWVLTVTFLPAFLMLLDERTLTQRRQREGATGGALMRMAGRLGRLGMNRPRPALVVGLSILALAIYGMEQNRVNDDPVKWFKESSPIRQANSLMNGEFGGTYMAYLVAEAAEPETMTRPEVLRYVAALQQEISHDPRVGKTTSLTDILRWINRVLTGSDELPNSRELAGQYLLLYLSSGGSPDTLDNFVDYGYQRLNLWLQLKTGDNQDMIEVMERINRYVAAHPLPGVRFEITGPTYVNVVWQQVMVTGMMGSFAGSVLTVFVIMAIEFRSLLWALIGVIPLLSTILTSYGVLFFIGKEIDMPIAVCSSLALGIGVDFAIHFVFRFRERYRSERDLKKSLLWTFGEPAVGILRNALILLMGFAVMLVAPLTPYVTVGAFTAIDMLVGALATLLLLPALIIVLKRVLLAKEVTHG
ncbi:MAG: MMPL family transporter [Nitrospirae bacterium]|nr:MMPL family transporter [Nitrospirota bacterium]